MILTELFIRKAVETAEEHVHVLGRQTVRKGKVLQKKAASLIGHDHHISSSSSFFSLVSIPHTQLFELNERLFSLLTKHDNLLGAFSIARRMRELATSEEDQNEALLYCVEGLMGIGHIKEAESLLKDRLVEVELRLSQGQQQGRKPDIESVLRYENLLVHHGVCLERRKALDEALEVYKKARMVFSQYNLMPMVRMFKMSTFPAEEKGTYKRVHHLYLQSSYHYANILEEKGMEEEAFAVSHQINHHHAIPAGLYLSPPTISYYYHTGGHIQV